MTADVIYDRLASTSPTALGRAAVRLIGALDGLPADLKIGALAYALLTVARAVDARVGTVLQLADNIANRTHSGSQVAEDLAGATAYLVNEI